MRPPAGEPAMEATRRRRHKNRRRSSTHVDEFPSKAAGHSVTLALDADSTAANLGYNRSNNLTGGNEEAALPQREETLQPHPRDNGRMGDKKRPHIIPPSHAWLASHPPATASGQRGAATESMTASGHEQRREGSRDRKRSQRTPGKQAKAAAVSDSSKSRYRSRQSGVGGVASGQKDHHRPHRDH